MQRRFKGNRPGDYTIKVGHHEEEGKFFFSSDHQQGWYDGEEKMRAEMEAHWVAVSFSLPMRVTGRPGLLSGLIQTIDEYIFIFHKDDQEIENPDSSYIPDFRKKGI